MLKILSQFFLTNQLKILGIHKNWIMLKIWAEQIQLPIIAKINISNKGKIKLFISFMTETGSPRIKCLLIKRWQLKNYLKYCQVNRNARVLGFLFPFLQKILVFWIKDVDSNHFFKKFSRIESCEFSRGLGRSHLSRGLGRRHIARGHHSMGLARRNLSMGLATRHLSRGIDSSQVSYRLGMKSVLPAWKWRKKQKL